MADSGFSIGKLLSKLKSFLSTMSSPLDGYDLRDVKVNDKDDIFSSIFSLESGNLKDERTGEAISDLGGNKIELNVLLKAINFRKVFGSVITDLSNLGMSDDVQTAIKTNIGLFTFLLGKGITSGEGYSAYDLSIESAKKRNEGLLGLDLTQPSNLLTACNYNGESWSWGDIAAQKLMYSLECQVPGKDFGAIENVGLSKVSNLISEYLVKVDVITVANEVQVDPNTLVLPILIHMQGALCKYYDSAYKKFINAEGAKPVEEVDQDELDDMADDIADSLGDTFDAAKRISVTLQKVTGSSEIKMTSIKATYNPSVVLADLEEIMDQDDFIDTITEEPQTFTIDVDDDGFDIDRCEGCQECDPCDSLGYLMTHGIMFYRNLYVLHWMAKGNDMMKLHLLTEELYEELIKEIDTLGELMVEKCGTVIDPNFTYAAVEIRPYEFQEGLDILTGYINSYINFIDYAYINQSSDVQSIMDEWLRFWNKQVNYFIKGQEI